MYKNILTTQRHLGTHDDGSQLFTACPRTGEWVAELRSPSGLPLFDPSTGEHALRATGATLEEALASLDALCDAEREARP